MLNEDEVLVEAVVEVVIVPFQVHITQEAVHIHTPGIILTININIFVIIIM